eukprot:369935-Rhodomonas_salina.2
MGKHRLGPYDLQVPAIPIIIRHSRVPHIHAHTLAQYRGPLSSYADHTLCWYRTSLGAYATPVLHLGRATSLMLHSAEQRRPSALRCPPPGSSIP